MAPMKQKRKPYHEGNKNKATTTTSATKASKILTNDRRVRQKQISDSDLHNEEEIGGNAFDATENMLGSDDDDNTALVNNKEARANVIRYNNTTQISGSSNNQKQPPQLAVNCADSCSSSSDDDNSVNEAAKGKGETVSRNVQFQTLMRTVANTDVSLPPTLCLRCLHNCSRCHGNAMTLWSHHCLRCRRPLPSLPSPLPATPMSPSATVTRRLKNQSLCELPWSMISGFLHHLRCARASISNRSLSRKFLVAASVAAAHSGTTLHRKFDE
jgi:hypothetical protein